jgi:hypothetical protein
LPLQQASMRGVEALSIPLVKLRSLNIHLSGSATAANMRGAAICDTLIPTKNIDLIRVLVILGFPFEVANVNEHVNCHIFPIIFLWLFVRTFALLKGRSPRQAFLPPRGGRFRRRASLMYTRSSRAKFH